MKLFNDSEFGIDLPLFTDITKAPLGRICALANDANYDASFLSEPLTAYITGVSDTEDLEGTLEKLAPKVPVGRRFEYHRWNEKAAFVTDDDDDRDIRAIGGDFPLISAPGSKADGATDNKGLAIVLDSDQGGENAATQQHYVSMIKRRLLRSEISRATRLLLANATSVGTPNWGPANAARDPDGDLLSLADASGDARGCDPSTVTIGGGASIKRKLATRGSDKAGAFASASMDYDELADFLEVDHVVRVKTRKQASATAKGKIANMVALAYYAQQGSTTEDPSNIKRFITNTPSGQFRVYIERRLKKTLIAVEHYSRIVITSSLGIVKLEPTYT